MRPPGLSDAVAVARALLALPPRLRAFALSRMLAEATRARAYLRTAGRSHPVWGDGTLMAAALRRRTAWEPPLSDAEWCACLMMVLAAIRAWPTGQPRAQDTQVAMAGSRSSRAVAIASPHSTQ